MHPLSKLARALRAALFLAICLHPDALRGATAVGVGQLDVQGPRLVVSPEAQTVPFDTPTIVGTELVGWPAGVEVPSDLLVRGELRGPEIDGAISLSTRPGESFDVPGLRLEGEYVLEDLRLVAGETLLTHAEPRAVTIRATQVLVTGVRSRALTQDELTAYGIVLGEDSRQALRLTFGFGVQGREVDYSVIVVPQLYGPDGVPGSAPRIEFPEPSFTASGGGSARWEPPQLVPFELVLPVDPEDVPTGGCDPRRGEPCFKDPPRPPLVGAVVFPTDVGLLRQQFAVVLLVDNAAPAGDPLTLRDLNARIQLPSGLRASRTEPPTPLGVPVPIRAPGADGELGTADDIRLLVAQASGQAEFLVEGLREGTHVVDVEIAGLLDGMPGGTVPVSGTASGAVVVRDPNLAISISHPQSFVTGVEYDLRLTVSNLGAQPANGIVLGFPTAGLSGARVVGEASAEVGSLDPGETAVETFRIESLRTGRVVSSSLRSDVGIEPRFDVSVRVGDVVPESPEVLTMPESIEVLPESWVEPATALGGLSHALAAAPAETLGGRPAVSEGLVAERIWALAQAGREVELGEQLFDAAALFALHWSGARDHDAAWDRLRRETPVGRRLARALGDLFEAEEADPVRRFERLLETGLSTWTGAVVATGASVEIEVSRPGAAESFVAGPDRLAEEAGLPFTESWSGSDARLITLGGEGDAWELSVRAESGSTSTDVIAFVPSENQSARAFRWSGVALAAGARASAELDPLSDPLLSVDDDGDGSVDRTIPPVEIVLAERPFAVVAAQQNAGVDPSGHVVDILFSREVDAASLYPQDPTRFQVPGRVSNGGLVPAEEEVIGSYLLGAAEENVFGSLSNGRLVRVVFDNPLSPFVSNGLSIQDVLSLGGEAEATGTVVVDTTVTTQATVIEGRVLGPTGDPLPLAQLWIHESDRNSEGICQEHPTSTVRADDTGRFRFDYVRDGPCGGDYRIVALSSEHAGRGEARGRVRFAAGVQEQDVVFLGRGTVRGRVTYENGSPVTDLEVYLSNVLFEETRRAHVDSDGRFEAADVAVGTVAVAAVDGEGRAAYVTVEMPRAGAVVEQDLLIVRSPDEETAVARGVVLGLDGVTPEAGAYVALYVDGKWVAAVRSAEDGTFDFGRVPAGIGEIEAFSGETRQSGARLFLELQPDSVQDVEVLLRDDRGTVQGLVRRRLIDGSVVPVPGAVVFVEGLPFHTVTDSEGRYVIDGVFRGTWRVGATELATGLRVSAQVTVATSGEVVDADLLFVDAPQGDLRGTVLGVDGTPVVGATVRLASGYRSIFWHHETVTDGEGFFRFGDLLPGQYWVHALSGDDGAIDSTVLTAAGLSEPLTLQFRRGAIHLQTFTRNEDGDPVGVASQVTYRITEVVHEWGVVSGSPSWHVQPTLADGTIEISDVIVGPYEIRVYNAFDGSEKRISGFIDHHGQIDEHEVVFEPTGSIRGVVLDADGETPAVGAEVRLRGGPFSDYDVFSDEQGRFEFALVPPGSYRIEVEWQDSLIFRAEEVGAYVERPGEEVDVEVRLPAQGSVWGWVEDADQEPVAGAVITLRERSFPRRTMVHTADEEGNFVFENVLAGDFALQAQVPTLGGLGGRTAASLSTEGEETLAILQIEPHGEVVGRVLSPETGEVVPNAQVELVDMGFGIKDAMTTGPDGEFRFRLLPLGAYQVRVLDPVTGRRGLSDSQTLESQGQVVGLDVVLEARGEVGGRVLDGGQAVPGQAVVLSSRGIRPFRTFASTDLDGEFVFGGIPEGSFGLSAQHPDRRRQAQADGFLAGEDVRVDIDLTFEPLGSLVVRAMNPFGLEEGLFEPVNVYVIQGGAIVAASSENPATFEGAVLPGPFEVHASEIGGIRSAVWRGRLDEAGQTMEVELRMPALGQAEVVVFDSFGGPVAHSNVQLQVAPNIPTGSQIGSTGTDHRITFDDVWQGTFTAVAEHPSEPLRGAVSGELTAEGETVRLEVMLEDSGALRGRVLRSDGVTPAEGALASLQHLSRPVSTVLAADADGRFEFDLVPLGSVRLVAQDEDLGWYDLTTSIDSNGQVVDVGDLILDERDPSVVAIDPPAGARDVSRTPVVSIRFSEPIDVNRFSGHEVEVWRRIGGQRATMSPTWSEDDTLLSLVPTAPLENFSLYDVRITTSVVDRAGRHLPWPERSSFYTVDTVPPAVVDVLPRDGEVQVPVDSNLEITFSEPVDLESLSGSALQLTDLTEGVGVGTTFQLRPGERRVLLTPFSMVPDRLMQIEVQGVRDLAGNVMSAPVVTTFWTPDETPPEITWVSPGPEEVFVSGDLVPVTVTASDNRGVERVVYEIGEWTFLGEEEPFGASLIAPVVAAPADVEVRATAVDIFGNETTILRTVRVEPHENANPPVVESTCFEHGDFVEPGIEVPISVTVFDDELVESVRFLVDGELVDQRTPVRVPETEPGFRWRPDQEAPRGQAFTLRVEARDFAGNVAVWEIVLSTPPEDGTYLFYDRRLLASQYGGQTLYLGQADFTLEEDLDVAEIVVLHGAVVRETVEGTQLTSAGRVRVQCGGEMRVENPAAPRLEIGPGGRFEAGVGRQADVVRVDGGASVADLQAGSVFVGGQLEATRLIAGSLEISSGGIIRPNDGQSGATISVTETLLLEDGAIIDVSGLGYWTATDLIGDAPEGIRGSGREAGGSHGGAGSTGSLEFSEPAGETYGSLYEPRQSGGGAGPWHDYAGIYAWGGHGGGWLEIEAGVLDLRGTLKANGTSDGTETSGGGGSIRVRASSIVGDGWMEARGGDSPRAGGGGGRIAVRSPDLTGWTGLSSSTAAGGTKLTEPGIYGGPGTVLLQSSSGSNGILRVDNGVTPEGAPRSGPATTLPVLTGGSILAVEVVGVDLWMRGAEAFRPRWIGAWVVLEDSEGLEIGAYRAVALEAGRLRLEGAGSAGGIAVSYTGEYRFEELMLANGADLDSETPLETLDLSMAGEVELPGTRLEVERLTIGAGSVVRPLSGSGLRLKVSDRMVVEEGAVLDVSGLGYWTATDLIGDAPEGIRGSGREAGGSYGGAGSTGSLEFSEPAGETYGSLYEPMQSGGGAGPWHDYAGIHAWGGHGGGWLEIEVGVLDLRGTLKANGTSDGTETSGGGGSIWVRATSIVGDGWMEARGGDSPRAGGGGGRIAVRSPDLTGWTGLSSSTAAGGTKLTEPGIYGGPGTVLLQSSSGSNGILRVDNGVTMEGTPRSGPATTLPVLTGGSILTVEVVGADLWVSGAEAFQPRWIGAWVVLEDSEGLEIGAYRAVALEAGRLQLEGAGSAGGIAVSYTGEYRFEELVLMNGADLDSESSVEAPDLRLTGEVELPSTGLEVERLTIGAGSVVRPLSGSGLRLKVSDRMIVEEGAVLDVSGLGYWTATDLIGDAPEGIRGSGREAGGSHGGAGSTGSLASSEPAGETYGSLYEPRQSGGGAGPWHDYAGIHAWGGHGGGWLEIEAGVLDLRGTLKANGTSDGTETSGGGGSIWVRANAIVGGGWMEALGGDSPRAGGGGGRIAVRSPDMTSWGGLSSSTAAGGSKLTESGIHGGPGTILLQSSSDSNGILQIDNGVTMEGTPRSGPATTLPVLAEGSILTVEVVGADLWVSGAEAFQPRWIGAWVVLEDSEGLAIGAYRAVALDAGRLRLEGAGSAGGTAVYYTGEYRFEEVVLANGADLDSESSLEAPDLRLTGDVGLPSTGLEVERLTIGAGSVVRPQSGSGLRLKVADRLVVEEGAVLDVTGLGYGWGSSSVGDAPEGILGAGREAGGSHGGVGTQWPTPTSAPAGETYGSLYEPMQLGGGAGPWHWSAGVYRAGGRGGGWLAIEAGVFDLRGTLKANGTSDGTETAGGGGSIWVRANTILGSGRMEALGGDSPRAGGGGGRIAVRSPDLTSWAGLSSSTAAGGTKLAEPGVYGGPGTILLQSSADSSGILKIDNGTSPEGVSRSGPTTTLPPLAGGLIGEVEVVGADLWVSGAVAFQPRWIGAWVVLEDSEGLTIGTYRAVALEAGRLRLEGASSAGGTAASYTGEYRFEEVVLENGADLDSESPVKALDLRLMGEVELPSTALEAERLTVRAGSIARPATGSGLRLKISDRLIIEEGAVVDVSGLGYGWASSLIAAAPDGVRGSGREAGGSHGGAGTQGFPDYTPGETYGSLFEPKEKGGGAGPWHRSAGVYFAGGQGGGWLELVVGVLELHGVLRANGVSADTPSAGGGGSVFVRADQVVGGGRIEALGGSASRSGGGGGRIAVWSETASLEGVAIDFSAEGGDEWSGYYGGPGTIYLRDATRPLGHLIVRQSDSPAPTTELPSIGRWIIGSVTPALAPAGAVWIEPQDPDLQVSLGVMGMFVRIDGVDHQVLGQDGRRRILVADASDVAVGQEVLGGYCFDEVTVEGTAHLVLHDLAKVGTWNVGPGAVVDVPDFEPPFLEILNPLPEAVVISGDQVPVSASVLDDSPIAEVRFSLGELTSTDVAAPWEWSFTAPDVLDVTPLTLVVEAVDVAGNRATSTRDILVEPIRVPALVSTLQTLLVEDVDLDSQASPGDVLEHVLTIRNEGDGPATGVEIGLGLPAWLELQPGSVTTTQGIVGSEDPVLVMLDELEASAFNVVRLRTVVGQPPAGIAELALQGEITSTQLAPVVTDDPATAAAGDATVTPLHLVPRLELIKTWILVDDADDDGVPSPGDALRYELVASNVGTASATTLELSDPIPTGTSIVLGSVATTGSLVSEDPVLVTFDELDFDASVTVALDVRIDATVPAGFDGITNQATLGSAELPPVSSDDPAVDGAADPTVTPLTITPALRASMVVTLAVDADEDGVPSPGDDLLYSISVENPGDAGTTDVALVDELPPHLLLDSDSLQSDQGSAGVDSEGRARFDLGALAAGGSAEASLRARVAVDLAPEVGEVLNQASLSSADVAPVLTDDPTLPGSEDPTGVVLRHPPTVAFAVDVVAVEEGDDGTTQVELTVRLDRPADRPLEVEASTVAGTASDGSGSEESAPETDFTPWSGVVAFAPGEEEQTLVLEVLGDTAVETDESFRVVLTSAPQARLGVPAEATVTVVADDLPTVGIEASAIVQEGDAGASPVALDVTLDVAWDRVVRVPWETVAVTATADTDYLEVNGWVEIAAGETAATLTVDVLGDRWDESGTAEGDETFEVRLGTPESARLGPASVAQVTIVDDDAARLTIADVEALEADGVLRVAVELGDLSLETVVVDWEVRAREAGGDPRWIATADEDFVASTGQVDLAPGDERAEIVVEVLDDGLLEWDEVFEVVIGSDVVPVDREVAELRILDDELCPGSELLINPDAEMTATEAGLPGWDGTFATGHGEPAPHRGESFFVAWLLGEGSETELAQTVDLGAWAGPIDAGTQALEVGAWLRTGNLDRARWIVEARDAGGSILDAVDSGDVTSPGAWTEVREVWELPVGTRSLVVRLRGVADDPLPETGGEIEAYFDDLSMRMVRTPSLEWDAVSILEPLFGESDVVSVPLRLSCPTGWEVVAGWSTFEGSALADVDYEWTVGELVFAPGTTAEYAEVTVFGDGEDEDPETFTVVVDTEVDGVVLLGGAGLVTIYEEGDLGCGDVPGCVFMDGFETGDLVGWDAAVGAEAGPEAGAGFVSGAGASTTPGKTLGWGAGR